MVRKMVVRTADGSMPILIEALAANEQELQELMKSNPDLLPVEELGLAPAPLLVIGRETPVASGAVDLICLSKGGEILIIEFKTGPQNTDFRHAVAQLLDYGAQIYGLDYGEFEQAVPIQFFASKDCTDVQLMGKRSLDAAASVLWPGITAEEIAQMKETISNQLQSGGFWDVLAAQRFTNTIKNVIMYMNKIAPIARFFAIELVKFDGVISAYESRTIIKPEAMATKAASRLEEAKFLQQIVEAGYRSALEEFFDGCRGLHYETYWGTVGCSIRLPNPTRTPVSVAWVNPPDRSGWNGLRDVTLGLDWYDENIRGLGEYAQGYSEAVNSIAGAQVLERKGSFRGVHLSPPAFMQAFPAILELLRDLYGKVNGPTSAPS